MANQRLWHKAVLIIPLTIFFISTGALAGGVVNLYPYYVPWSGAASSGVLTGTPYALYLSVTGANPDTGYYGPKVSHKTAVAGTYRGLTWNNGIWKGQLDAWTSYTILPTDGSGNWSGAWTAVAVDSANVGQGADSMDFGYRLVGTTTTTYSAIYGVQSYSLVDKGGWLSGHIYSDIAHTIPLSNYAVLSFRGDTIVGCYLTENNHVVEGYDSSNAGYFKMAAPSGRIDSLQVRDGNNVRVNSYTLTSPPWTVNSGSVTSIDSLFVAPSVVSVSPANNAVNVNSNTTISVTFDRLINASTIDTASFAVSGVKQARYYPDSIRPAANSTSYTFYVQDSLRKSDTITVTLSTAIADTGGNMLTSPYTWKFYTIVPETIKPYLISSVPADGAERIAVSSTVALTFSEALLPATVDTGSFELLGKKRSKYPINAPVLSAGNTVVTLTPTDSLYYGDTIEVHIKPLVTDLSDNLVQDTSISFLTKIRPGLTISDIQSSVYVGTDSSIYTGQTVTVSGVVTAVVSNSTSTSTNYVGTFYMQDGSGAWNGIYVFDTNYPVNVGDSITVSALVASYYSKTQLKAISSMALHKTGCQLPAPVILSTSSFATGSSLAESYEGVLVSVMNVAVTNDSLGNNEWQIDDGSGPLRVDDFISSYTTTGYSPNTGDSLIMVRGILDYSFYNFKILPRNPADIIDYSPPRICFTLPTNNNKNVPVSMSVNLYFNKQMKPDSMVAHNISITGTTSGAKTFAAVYDTASYRCRLIPAGNFVSGETVSVWVSYRLVSIADSSLDGNGDGIASHDSTDDYSFSFITISDVISISTVQKSGPDGFASQLVGQRVIVEGIVSGPDKYFSSSTASNASWYLDDGTGGINIYGGTKGQFIIGKRAVVIGQVTEYNGVTEIASSADSIALWDLANDLVSPKIMLYNQLLGETIEGLLASVEGTISSIPAYAGGGYNMEIRNGNAPIAVRISEASKFDLSPFTYGTKVRVTGIVSQYDKEAPYNSGYQLVPRFGEVEYYNGLPLPLDIMVLTDSAAASAAAEIVSIKPNPFSLDLGEVGIIEINAPADDHLTLRIYDLKGRLVKTCLNNVPGGHQYYYWDGTDDSSRRANIGMYIAHLRSVTAEGASSDKTKIIVLGTPLK